MVLAPCTLVVDCLLPMPDPVIKMCQQVKMKHGRQADGRVRKVDWVVPSGWVPGRAGDVVTCPPVKGICTWP